VDTAAFQLLESEFVGDFSYTHINVDGEFFESIDDIDEELCKTFSDGKICVLKTVLANIGGHISTVATQFSFNNSELSMLPENSNASLNKSLVPASKLIGLYIGSPGLEFPEDGLGRAPVRVYFDHGSLVEFHENSDVSLACVAWDNENLSWYDSGCYYNSEDSNFTQS